MTVAQFPRNRSAIAAGDDPLIPPGEYEVQLRSYRTALMFNGRTPKLILTFTITRGEQFGMPIRAFYNIQKLYGKAQQGRRFKAGQKSKFFRTFTRLFPGNFRGDRLPMSRFDGVTLLAKIDTVREANGEPLVGDAQYSKVESILQVEES